MINRISLKEYKRRQSLRKKYPLSYGRAGYLLFDCNKLYYEQTDTSMRGLKEIAKFKKSLESKQTDLLS